ncbi:RHS repeat-associated core domain-containing protein [Pseudomonas cremoricolorata]|uniref:RHS repeat-associated core domain-containing protein n=1 Tax=Pseudomonas cremoricolorata TaxID=157783 RepID=UPI00067EEA8A|nr:RHS repeat-associated core domain-containing protein [Pseudomonas cremoricolorata]
MGYLTERYFYSSDTVIARAHDPICYDPYGHSGMRVSAASRVSFCAEFLDPISQLYMLGQGHRGYSSTLRRFVSQDHLSPFDHGGMNAYAYCANDPVNFHDPSGQFKVIQLDANWTLKSRPHYLQSSVLTRSASTMTTPLASAGNTRVHWGLAHIKRFEQSESSSGFTGRESLSHLVHGQNTRMGARRAARTPLNIEIKHLKFLPDAIQPRAAAYIRAANARTAMINSDVRKTSMDSRRSKDFVAAHNEFRTHRTALKSMIGHADPLTAGILAGLLRAGR